MHFSGFPESLKSQILATMGPPPNILGLLQTSHFELLGGWNLWDVTLGTPHQICTDKK